MKTNTNAYKALIRAHILESIYDYEGEDSERAKAEWIFNKFAREYDYPDNRKRTPNDQARVAEWLAGLPLNIAYSNYDIIKLYEAWHGETIGDDKAGDAKADRIIANWFNHVAFHLIKLWEDHGLKL